MADLLGGRSEQSLWRSEERRRGQYRRKFKEVAKPWLRDAYMAASRAVEQGGGPADAARAVRNVEIKGEERFRAVYEEAATHAARRIREAVEARRKSISYAGRGRFRRKEQDVVDRAVTAWIAEHAANRITGIEETTMEQVRRRLKQAQQQGLPVMDQARELQKMGEQFPPYRAAMIARTESGAAWQGGQHESAKRRIPDSRKEWISAGDGRVRDEKYDHREADGQIVGVDEPFRVSGEALQHPCDPSGSAGNVIHCRCAVGYVMD